MYKLFATVKLAGIGAFMTVVNFLILLHKAIVAFYRVMRGEMVVPINPDEPNTPMPPAPPSPPQPPPPTPPGTIVIPLPFPINVVWDTVTDVIANHIYENLFGARATFKSNYYSRQWLLDFIRNDPELQIRISEVLKQHMYVCGDDQDSANTTP